MRDGWVRIVVFKNVTAIELVGAERGFGGIVLEFGVV